jgi:ABC-type bacteriocin/lantibiotic exporter with double-glycine peptidase domain
MTTVNLFQDYIKILSLKTKKKLLYLLLLLFLSSIAELFSFSLVLPFLSVLLKPNIIYYHERFQIVNEILNIENIQDLQIKFTLFFCLLTIISTIIKVYTLKFSTRISFNIGSEISVTLYNSILKRPYEKHVETNSNTLVNSITYKSSQIIYGGFLPVFIIVTNILVVASILVPLLFLYPIYTLIILIFVFVSYYIVTLTFKLILKKNGKIISNYSDLIQKQLKESLSNIRDIILDNNYELFVNNYRSYDNKLKDALYKNQYIGAIPKYYLESFAILILSFTCLQVIITGKNLETFIPTIGIFLIAFQRILPSAQNIFNYWTAYVANKFMMEEVLEMLNQKSSEKTNLNFQNDITFKKSIKLVNISFKYKNNKVPVINNVSFVINKGDKIAVLGETGAGKSTLIDLIMGLLSPTGGHIYIDDLKLNEDNLKQWQKKISHVPQTINLIDASIKENIKFNRELTFIDVDLKITEISKTLGLNEFVDKKELGFNEQIGEGGISLSGGQRQRIGIARALYKNADLYVLDEATNALDSKTEMFIYESLFSQHMDKTFILITHNKNALKYCNKIIKISKNAVILETI